MLYRIVRGINLGCFNRSSRTQIQSRARRRRLESRVRPEKIRAFKQQLEDLLLTLVTRSKCALQSLLTLPPMRPMRLSR